MAHDSGVNQHLKDLWCLFQHIHETGLKLKKSKCNFLKRYIHYLGHMVLGDGIEPILEKLKSMRELPAPTNPTEVKQFLGLVGYYRIFVTHFADIAHPLTNLTKKDTDYIWTPQYEQAFQWLNGPDPSKLNTFFTYARI